MNSKIFYSADYVNENFEGLFDRIINLRFFRADGTSFTLRSDYEPIWANGELEFKTCQPKPEIRVKYTQYQSTMINVDIYVTNLNIIESSQRGAEQYLNNPNSAPVSTKTDKETNLPNDSLVAGKRRINKIEIEMGYRGQFHNWAQDKGKAFTIKQRYDAFQELRIPSMTFDTASIVKSQLSFNQHRRCTVEIEWAVQNNNPPDRITQFHGYVGSAEAGFQPFSKQALEYASTEGTIGRLTKNAITSSLDDRSLGIAFVARESENPVNYGKAVNIAQVSDSVSSTGGYRNFFNGGEAFTLLEGFCFHMLTRRFIRSGIDVKRNPLLEQAAFEYIAASEYKDLTMGIEDKKKEVTQALYEIEMEYSKDSFIEKDGVISLAPGVSASVKDNLDKKVNSIMVELYAGSRYTIKNLPEYRKLYLEIRKTLDISFAKGDYISWWDAARQLSLSNLTLATPRESIEIERTITGARDYKLKLETGKMDGKDAYFSSMFGDDWILPLQNNENSIAMRDSRGQTIKFKPPTTTTPSGFTGTGSEVEVKCFSGLFEVPDAYMFGVPVLCSKEASKVFADKHAGAQYVECEFMRNSQSQIEWICETWGLQYYKLHNGGYYLYAISEASRGTASQKFVTQQSNRPFKIPAIYDLTLSPLRKMRMPFMGFLDPMSLIEWNSTAAIGEMVSFYFQPNKGRNFFMVIKNEIDFSTTEDHNTMELDLVDTQWVDKAVVPIKAIDQQKKPVYVEVIIIPDYHLITWQKIYESPITKIPTSLAGEWISAEDVAEFMTTDLRISGPQFELLMRTWNVSLFKEAEATDTGWTWNDWRPRIDKTANSLYGKESDAKINFPAIDYCLPLLPTTLRRVYCKFPFMPDVNAYDKMTQYDTKYILVYEAGVWEMRLRSSINYQIGAV